MKGCVMDREEELQNAINIAVWRLEEGDTEKALETLRPFYQED